MSPAGLFSVWCAAGAGGAADCPADVEAAFDDEPDKVLVTGLDTDVELPVEVTPAHADKASAAAPATATLRRTRREPPGGRLRKLSWVI